jgi:hypothetical protein
MKKWTKKPFIMGDFYDGQQSELLVGGDLIQTEKDIDFDRVAGSKSKKAKGIY